MLHPLAARITKPFPDLLATAFTESNCLLSKGFIVKVYDRGAVSDTGTEPLISAESYAVYFDPFTRRLKQSYPLGSSPWLLFSLARTAVPLVIYSFPFDVLPDADDQLSPFFKRSILNAKAIEISGANSEENVNIGDDSGQAPSNRNVPPAQALDLTTPHPPRREVTPAHSASQPMPGPAPPSSPTSQRVQPGNQ